MSNPSLKLYIIFHLNLAYSSIEKEQRQEVIQRCYWPLLQLADKYNLPFGIEASGYTLEKIAEIDPTWLKELRCLITDGPCEFIGSGYAQIIGPLVPAHVNAANLRLGNQTYNQLLGLKPTIALINEQAYSAGLIQLYLDAGYRAILMDWDNPARYHPQWELEWCYLPQYACGQNKVEIAIIWCHSIGFQKFQRYAHGDMDFHEYIDYLTRHFGPKSRLFPLYGNDIEIFDFRPGRYHTEADLQEEGEWKRIEKLFDFFLSDQNYEIISPSKVLEHMTLPGAGNRLSLESPEQPIPVKKQLKYNINRWAVTGRDDFGINTTCWRIYEALKAAHNTDENMWREICYLWSSDFRTHISEKRWTVFIDRLSKFEKMICTNSINTSVCIDEPSSANNCQSNAIPPDITVKQDHLYVSIDTAFINARLNCRRGLAINGLWFKKVSSQALIGTLHHGYYWDMLLGADLFTGHLIYEIPGEPKITDLNPVKPVVQWDEEGWVVIYGVVPTSIGPIPKWVRFSHNQSKIEVAYQLDLSKMVNGSLRLGHITFIPTSFDRSTLFYRTHNGGYSTETLPLEGKTVDHGSPFSLMISATQGVGLTEGIIEIGDSEKLLKIECEKATAAFTGLMTYRETDHSFFCRLAFTGRELDETCRPIGELKNNSSKPLIYKFSISAESLQ